MHIYLFVFDNTAPYSERFLVFNYVTQMKTFIDGIRAKTLLITAGDVCLMLHSPLSCPVLSCQEERKSDAS